MKTKAILAVILTLLLSLAGCSGDDAAKALATIDDSGASNSNNQNNSGVTSKTYNLFNGTVYEAYTFRSDGTMDVVQAFVGIAWFKAVGTYSFDTAGAGLMTIDIKITEASNYYVTNVANICTTGVLAGDIPYRVIDANTYEFPGPGGPVANYVIDSLSGVTPADLSAMPNECP